MTVIKVHGCSGAGRADAVQDLMECGPHEPLRGYDGYVEAYGLTLEGKRPTYVLGEYQGAMGGMDTVKSTNKAMRLIDRYAREGNIVFEGLLQSTCYGRMGVQSMAYGANYVYAFLDTPLDLCIENIRGRKYARLSQVRERYNLIEDLRHRLVSEGAHRVVTLRHAEPLAPQLLELLE